jgi:hypothetical protein
MDGDDQMVAAGAEDLDVGVVGGQAAGIEVLAAAGEDGAPEPAAAGEHRRIAEGVLRDPARGDRVLLAEFDDLEFEPQGVQPGAGDRRAGHRLHAEEDPLADPEVVDPGCGMTAREQAEVGRVAAGHDGKAAADASFEPLDAAGEGADLLGGRHDAAEAGEVHPDAGQLEPGGVEGAAGGGVQVAGLEPLAQVAHLDHEHDAVPAAGRAGGTVEPVEGVRLGVERQIRPPDGVGRTASHRQAQQPPGDPGVGRGQPAEVPHARVPERGDTAGEHRRGDAGIAARRLGDPGHRHPVTPGHPHDDPRVVRDRLEIDDQPRPRGHSPFPGGGAL